MSDKLLHVIPTVSYTLVSVLLPAHWHQVLKLMSERGSGLMGVTVPIEVQRYRTTIMLLYTVTPKLQHLPAMKMEVGGRLHNKPTHEQKSVWSKEEGKEVSMLQPGTASSVSHYTSCISPKRRSLRDRCKKWGKRSCVYRGGASHQGWRVLLELLQML